MAKRDTGGARAARYKKAQAEMAAKGVKYIQAEVPDIDGMLRGKILNPKKALSSTGSSHCVIQYGMSPQDNLIETPLGSFENGFPDFIALADLDTLVHWPWAPEYASVFNDMYDPENRKPSTISPREVLRRVERKARRMGFVARAAVEYEAVVLHADPELTRAGRFTELKPMSTTLNAYSLTRIPDLRTLMEEFLSRMAGIGIEIDAFHTEKGPGQFEFAISHCPSLEAADKAIRAKFYLKQLCAEMDLAITFMSKWNVNEVGTGGHVHQSLWRDGKPAFSQGRPGTFSTLGKQYVAGMIHCMRELTALYNPNINSYRRRASQDWCPENASWSRDNRSAALRVITQPTAAGARIETRQPGGETNPYLSIAVGLASGLYGIENELMLMPPAKGDAGTDPRFDRLPVDLREAIDCLRASKLAPRMFGADFIEHFMITREDEWRLWKEWLANNVTDFELRRYFFTA